METRTLEETGLKPFIYVAAKNISTVCQYPKTLWEAQFKGDGLKTKISESEREKKLGTSAL
jgi:hypothetical protein